MDKECHLLLRKATYWTGNHKHEIKVYVACVINQCTQSVYAKEINGPGYARSFIVLTFSL